jgi:membrane protease YdiL (CAAX protease family)
MLFWAKQTTSRGLITLLLLVGAAYASGAAVHQPLTLHPRLLDAGLGVAIWLVILTSDLALHALFCRVGGAGYRAVGVEFRTYVRRMTPAACIVGGLVAGLGEEPLFRGVLLPLLSSLSPAIGLLATAALFGAAHFIRPSLWLLAVWAAWQGILLGAVYTLTGSLAAVMLAHFLHDTTAFLALKRP